MSDYKPWFERLKDPRWQKKRLEVMERASFRCEWCLDSTTTLHIHHTYYERSTDPWDYPEWSLKCLCEVCHEYAGDLARSIAIEIARVPDSCSLEGLCSAIRNANDSHSWIKTECPPTVRLLIEEYGGD